MPRACRPGSTSSCSTAPPSPTSTGPTGRWCGSTPPTSTTAPVPLLAVDLRGAVQRRHLLSAVAGGGRLGGGAGGVRADRAGEPSPTPAEAPLPPWVDRVLKTPTASAQVRAFAQALKRYRDPGQIRYVKLADGGLVDNFGLSGIVIARAISEKPYAPLTPERAVKLQPGAVPGGQCRARPQRRLGHASWKGRPGRSCWAPSPTPPSTPPPRPPSTPSA